MIDSPGRVSFESLGWTEDVVLTSDLQTAKVRFRLPDDAVQGESLWYGARVAYEWTGDPGVAVSGGQGGDYSKLIGEWNGYGFYQRNSRTKRFTFGLAARTKDGVRRAWRSKPRCSERMGVFTRIPGT